MGLIGLPYFLIFPWIDVLISLLLLVTIASVLITGNVLQLLFFVVMMIFIQSIIVSYAIHIDRERKWLVLLVVLENLWYSHLINYITLKAGLHFLKGHSPNWNKLERLGKNVAPIAG